MTISEIAKMADVSPATVSRFLNGGYVSEEKKEVIGKVIRETGYVPLNAGQHLKNKKSKSIGVIVPRLNSEAIARMVDGITKRVNGTDYQIILTNTDNNPENEIENLKFFEFDKVDGVILSATEVTDELIKILNRYNKPVVIISQNIENFFCVYNDNESVSYSATKHLIEQGCEKIIYLGVLEDDSAAGRDRHRGFNKALKEYGLKPVAEKIVDFSVVGGYTGIQEILENQKIEDFDGIFCASDNIAIGAINRLSFTKKKVPEDVKIIGVGDSTLSKAFLPSISTVHLFYEELGDQAADLIIDILEGKKMPIRQIQLGSELCIRESSTELNK